MLLDKIYVFGLLGRIVLAFYSLSLYGVTCFTGVLLSGDVPVRLVFPF